MRGISKLAEGVTPYIEILKLKGSFVDISTMLGTSAFIGEVDWRTPGAIFSGVLIHSSADIYNDIYDREIDKICKPKAPIASGRMRIGAAWLYLCSLTIVGLSVALHLSWVLFFGYLIGIMSGYVLYSHPRFRLKDVPVVSIGIIALFFAIESLGLWSVYRPLEKEAFVVAGYVFVLVFSLVFMKDFRDVKGDINSLPLRLGVERASRVSCALALLPLGAISALLMAGEPAIVAVTAVIYSLLAARCVKILALGDAVARGSELKNRMILSICLPNITIFLFTFGR